LIYDFFRFFPMPLDGIFVDFVILTEGIIIMGFLKRFWKQYKLYILAAAPIILAAIISVIIVATEDEATGGEPTQNATSSVQSSYTDSPEPGTENTGATTEPVGSEAPPTLPLTLGKSKKIEISETQNNRLLLEGSIEVPSFENPNQSPIVDAINESLVGIGNSLKDHALKRPLDLAKTELTKGGGDDLPYKFNVKYSVKLSNTKVLSVVFSRNEDTGDEHEFISDYCVNYDLLTGKRLMLEQIFNCDKTVYLPKIRSYIKEQIALNPGKYYDDLKLVDLVDFEADSEVVFLGLWYFSSDGLVLVFNPYKIAGFSAGIIKFTMPYSQLSNIMKINPVD
jgi:hypothetical protein